MRKLLSIGTLVVLVALVAGCKAVITPNAPYGWFFVNEGASGSGYFVNGPGDPPAGRGSALLTIDGTGREAIATSIYQGRSLSAISRLEYATYQAFSGSPDETLYLQFDVDYDATDSSTAYQGRLVYVPQVASPIVARAWQTWDTLSGGAAWYSSASGGSGFRPIVGGVVQSSPPCNQATFCTWSQVLAEYPNARVRPKVGTVPGLLLIKAGGPATGGFVGATDNLIVEVDGAVIEHNFEPGDGHIAVTAANAGSLGFGFAQETPSGSGAFVQGPNGADGAGSAVRRAIGIEFEGMTFPERFFVVSTPFDFAQHLERLSYVNYVADTEEWCVLLKVRGLWRCLFPTHDESDDDILASAERRLQGVHRKATPYEVMHRTLYRVHQRVATTYRAGRVLLAGDAAHINNPLGGMGMNGGLHDAWVLCRKLVSGADLDAYERERRPVAIDYINANTARNRKLMAERDPAARQQAQDEMCRIAADPAAAKAFLMKSSMIETLRRTA